MNPSIPPMNLYQIQNQFFSHVGTVLALNAEQALELAKKEYPMIRPIIGPIRSWHQMNWTTS